MEGMNLIARARARGWGLLLLPLGLQYAILITQPAARVIVLAGACLITAFAPRVATKAVPFAVLILGCVGLGLIRSGGDAAPVLYGLAPATTGSWGVRLILPEAVLFLAAGAWLYLRVSAPGAGQVRASARRLAGAAAGRPSRWAWLLLPVLALAVEELGRRHWLGLQWWTTEWTAVLVPVLVAGAILLILRAPSVAAVTAVTALQILGLYGIILVATWTDAMDPRYFGVVQLNGQFGNQAAGLGQGLVLLAAGAFLMPRAIREHIAGAPDRELAALTERVETLTQTRTEATDAAAAELRRIERNLHDGAQARLVAVGMSLRAAEKMFASNPEAALALVSEARETSSRALTDLRDLVAASTRRCWPTAAWPTRSGPWCWTRRCTPSSTSTCPARSRCRSARPSTSRSPRCWSTRSGTLAPARSGSTSATRPARSGPCSPTTARAAPIPPRAPA